MCLCIDVHHSFFFHSSIHGHLDYFHVLAIVNNAAVNIMSADIFLQVVISFLLDKYPEIELLDHMVVLFFFFLNFLSILHTYGMFSAVVALI